MTDITSISLPSYLQKYIIKILCNEINNVFSLMEIKIVGSGYRENEKYYKKLTFDLSMVSHGWFETVSNNIFISFDNNFNDSYKYSIIKSENIQFLKYGFNHSKNQFYSMENGKDIKIEEELINQQIEKLSTTTTTNVLSNLLIRNVNSVGDDLSQILDKLNSWKNTGHTKISINEITLNIYSTELSIQKLYENVEYIFTIICCNEMSINLFYNVFEKYVKSIKELIFYQNYLPNSIWSLYSSGKSFNHLQKLELIGIIGPISITINELLILMSPKITSCLKYLSFRLCFDNLVYFLSNDQERSDCDIKRCRDCSSVCEVDETESEFNLKWLDLIQLLKEHSSPINQLFITTHCNSKLVIFDQDCKYSNKFPNSFLNQFSQFISLFPNLLLFSSNLPDFLFYKSIAQKSNSLTHIQAQYNDNIMTSDKKDLKSDIEKDINQNDSSSITIQDFKIVASHDYDEIYYHYIKKNK